MALSTVLLGQALAFRALKRLGLVAVANDPHGVPVRPVQLSITPPRNRRPAPPRGPWAGVTATRLARARCARDRRHG